MKIGGWAYSLSNLLHCIVAIRLSKEMLTKEHNLRLPVLKTHKRMLPISDMVPQPYVQDHITLIVAVEVKPESVNDAVTLLNDY